MTCYPLLLRPRLLAIRNSWSGKSHRSRQSGQDLVVFCFCVTMMIGLYFGTSWVLARFNEDPTVLFLPPAIPLGLIGLLLFTVVLISSIAAGITTLYQAEDLDLILASPIPVLRLYVGRGTLVGLTTSWMPTVFMLPMLLAFGRVYHAPPEYFLIAPLFLGLFFTTAVIAGMVIATLLIFAIPPYRTKYLLLGASALAIVAVFYLVALLRSTFAESTDTGQLFRTMEMLSLSSVPWLPSSWLANFFDRLLVASWREALPEFVLLLGVPLFLGSGLFLLLHFSYARAFSRARTLRVNGSKRQDSSNWLANLLARLTDQASAALSIKEIRWLGRNISLTIQLFMISGIIALYLVNLRLFVSIDAFPLRTRSFWTSLFFIMNFCMGCFVMVSLCTRFAFPSVSHEGRAFWILQSAPLSLQQILRAKFWSWYIPIAAIGAIVLGAGAFAISPIPIVPLLSAFAAPVIAIGIVGLAIGLGGRYAQLTHEDSSQLAASFGSLIFMSCSALLILVTLIPLWCALFIPPPPVLGAENFALNATLWVTFLGGCMALFNSWVGKWGLAVGARGLAPD